MDPGRLSSIPLFEGLSRKELEQVAHWADEVDVPEGRHLLDEGRFAYEFFVIADGEVEVRHDDRVLGKLGPGDFVGEIALLEHQRRSATVVTTSPVRAIVMSERDFDTMVDVIPKVAERVRRIEQERLQRG